MNKKLIIEVESEEFGHLEFDANNPAPLAEIIGKMDLFVILNPVLVLSLIYTN